MAFRPEQMPIRLASRASESAVSGDQVWVSETAEAESIPFGFRIARDSDLASAHALAEEVMGMPLTALSVLWAAHEYTTASAWVFEDGGRITGTILLLPLTPDGESDVLEGRFVPSSPQPHQLCAPGDPFPAIYFWLFAGGDGRARRGILRTCLAWRDGAYAGVRGYARAASPSGKSALKGLGFTPIQSALPDLFHIAERS